MFIISQLNNHFWILIKNQTFIYMLYGEQYEVRGIVPDIYLNF